MNLNEITNKSVVNASENLHKQDIQRPSGVLVVIPTRNRADLAIAAIRSVLSQPSCDVSILVSDNSTTAEDSHKLSQFCEQVKDNRLRYIRPPDSLSMSDHWDWAIQQALHLYNVSHVLYLTDRMIFKPNELKTVLDLAALYPDNVLSYGHDRVNDYNRPIYLQQRHWTGKLFEIDSSHLLFLSSRYIAHMCLPRMLNCIVPRCVLESMHKRFGNIFSSISPDYCFGFRCLEVVDSILYYDNMPLLDYALDRSNGASGARGVPSRDSVDFMANLGQTQINFFAPISEFRTVCNAIIHEYCFVKHETKSPKFQDVDKSSYLRAISRQLGEIQNPQLKLEMEALLRTNGWNKREKIISSALKVFSLKMVLKLLDKALFPAKKFKTVAAAIDYAARLPRRKFPVAVHLRFLKGRVIKCDLLR